MKQISKFLIAIGLPLAAMMSACGPSHIYPGSDGSGSSDQPEYGSSPGMTKDLKYNTDGVWDQCFKVDPPASLTLFNVMFSHYAYKTDDGVEWEGFTPSNSDEVIESKKNLWGNPTGHGVVSTPFMVAKWNPNESLDEVPNSPSCAIRLSTGINFNPFCVYVTNSCATLGAVLYGDENGLEPFKSSDYLTLLVNIVRDGKKVATIEQPLVKAGTSPLGNWIAIDLRDYDNVEMIYFQLKSSKNKDGVLALPPYFCLDYIMFDI